MTQRSDVRAGGPARRQWPLAWRPSAQAQSLVEVAAEQWRRGLVDVSGSNRRLFYKPLQTATLDLMDAEPRALIRLLSGDEVRIAQLFPAREEQRGGSRQARARRSAEAIAKKAIEVEEETGANPVRLAIGLATFESADAGVVTGRGGPRVERTPRAPLVLLPVRFTYASGSRAVASLALDGDPEVNSALRYVLRTQHHADLDEESLLAAADPDGPDGLAIDPNLLADAATRALTAPVAEWTVLPHLAIDYFGSDRELMLRDLTDTDQLAAHPVIAAMTGDAGARAFASGDPITPLEDVGEQHRLDLVPSADEFLILDADASQQQVIDLALSGRSLVVQGPPGTGKSQTISNVIAECTARGKTVLFVAQKRAAIEAVLGRLKSRDLGHLVLEVFDAKTKRSHVLQQLRDAIEGISLSAAVESGSLHKASDDSKKFLMEHRDELHAGRDALGGGSYIDLLSWLIEMDPSAQNQDRLPMHVVSGWGRAGVDSHATAVTELVRLGALDPGWDSGPGWNPHAVVSDELAMRGYDAAVTARSILVEVRAASEWVGRETSFAPPSGIAEAEALIDVVERSDALADAIDPVLLDPDRTSDEELSRLIHCVSNAATRKQDRAAGLRIGWWARRSLRARTRALTGDASLDAAYAYVVEAAALRRIWGGPVLRTGSSATITPGLAALDEQLQCVNRLVQRLDIGGLPWAEMDSALAWLAEDQRRANMPRAHELAEQLQSAGAGSIMTSPRSRLEHGSTLPPEEAGDRLRWSAYSTLLENLSSSLPAVARAARPGEIARATQIFRAADALGIEINAARVRRAAAEAARARLTGNPEQRLALQAELKKKRKLRALRELLEIAPDAMLAAAPCWAMSPLLVSRYLPAAPIFDIVVYDEASQVTVPDAVPSMMRGRQIVVAGDDRQLPPTLVFTKLLDGDGHSVSPDLSAHDAATEPLTGDDPETGTLDGENPASAMGRHEQEQEHVQNSPLISVATGYHSVLTALGAILPERTLLWHYRSRDERLIAVSNSEVYKNRLITFPGPAGAESLRHVIVPPSLGVGTHNKSPQAEVDEAVRLCLEHAETQRDVDPANWSTLGVIAMGSEHASRIEKQLFEFIAASDDEHLLDYFAATNDEPVFVKNIERVQGDERDHIILTVGYGPSVDGRMRYVWGPLLGEYGVNRLNVAISRSRSRMTLLTSFTPDQLREDGSSSRGYQLMRTFVFFAASGGTRDLTGLTQTVQMNGFEYDIYRRLTRAGLDVDPQYGVGGYRLDFAVRHPDRSGRHVLAVEADGATYHSGFTARERDRLRQQHLEALGWRFHRIWSADYWRDPDAEIAATVAAADTAVRRLLDGELAADPPPTPRPEWTGRGRLPVTQRSPSHEPPTTTATPSWVTPGAPISTYHPQQLTKLVTWLRQDGIIRLPDDEITMLMNILGYNRRGTTIMRCLHEAITTVDQSRIPDREGG